MPRPSCIGSPLLQLYVFHGVFDLRSRLRKFGGDGVNYQGLGGRNDGAFLRPLRHHERPFDLAVSGPFYERFYAYQVALPCRPLVPLELSYGPVVCFELELEKIWGDYGLNPVERGPPEDYIVGRRHVNHEKINFLASETGLVSESHR